MSGSMARGEGTKMDAPPGSKNGGGDEWGFGRFDDVRRDTMMSSDRDPISGQGPTLTITETETPLFPKRKELPMMFYFVTS